MRQWFITWSDALFDGLYCTGVIMIAYFAVKWFISWLWDGLEVPDD